MHPPILRRVSSRVSQSVPTSPGATAYGRSIGDVIIFIYFHVRARSFPRNVSARAVLLWRYKVSSVTSEGSAVFMDKSDLLRRW